MDVHCSTCAEPWDVDHLRHDAIYNTDLSEDEIAEWRRLMPKQRLAHHYRERFKAARWEFGTSILDVRRCPACPPGAKPDPGRVTLKSAIVESSGDDEDGIASTMEDFRL